LNKKESLYLPKKRGPKESIFENQYTRMYRTCVHFQGFTKEYFVTEMGERVSVMLIEREKVLLVSQYRFLMNGLSWELPGGAVRKDETPEQAAGRECLEETGIRAMRLIPFLGYNITLDCLDNYTRIFICSKFEFQEEKGPDPREIVEKAWIPIDRCLGMIEEKEIKDSMTIMGLLSYALRKRVNHQEES